MILLAPDRVALYRPPGDADEHGWAEGPSSADPDWTGPGSLQLAQGINGLDAADQGGAGPFSPNSLQTGEIYLPEDAQAFNGCAIACRDRIYVLSFVRQVPDPSGGSIGCLVANVTEVNEWLTPRLFA